MYNAFYILSMMSIQKFVVPSYNRGTGFYVFRRTTVAQYATHIFILIFERAHNRNVDIT